jgi:hypothetical protein
MIERGIDADLFSQFEKGLNPRFPDRSLIPARILGYGEISTIFEILHDSQQGLACKRMPIFKTEAEINRYEHLVHEYNRVLSQDIRITVPNHETVRVYPDRGNMIVYIIQEKLPAESICHRAIHRLDTAGNKTLFLAILGTMKRVWEFNGKGGEVAVGLDGQLSNWSIRDYDASFPTITGDTEFSFIDTSTPLMRMNGAEQLEPDLFLRSTPSFLVWLIKAFFLQGVLDRYYDFHLVVVDLIANLYKEGRSDLVPLFIDTANGFFDHDGAPFATHPITEKEVKAYYREDALIWRLFLALRKLDRFISTHITRKPYPYILPGKIRR